MFRNNKRNIKKLRNYFFVQSKQVSCIISLNMLVDLYSRTFSIIFKHFQSFFSCIFSFCFLYSFSIKVNSKLLLDCKVYLAFENA